MLAEPADVDAAVAAAQDRVRDLERDVASSARARIMFAFRELVDEHKDELARIVALRARQGRSPTPRARSPRPRGRRVRVRHPAAAQGRVLRAGLDRRRRYSIRQPLGVVRRHHAVQLPGDGADVDVSGGDRVRQHVRAQAVRARSVGLQPGRRAVRRGRPAGRRVQRRARRQGRGRRAAGPPGRRRGVVRRLDADRQVRLRARDRRPASACRRSAARRTTRSCCPTPTSTSPPTS